MKKPLILVVLLTVVCFCTSSFAADAAGHQWYVGIGGSWAIEDFDSDDVEDFLEPIDVDFDDAFGVNASFGYHVNDNCSIAFVYSYLTGFDSDESIAYTFDVGEVLEEAGLDYYVDEDDLADLGLDPDEEVVVSIGADIEVDIMTFMVEGKYAMSGNFSPYLVLGIGLMYADTDGDLEAGAAFAGESFSLSFGDSDSDTRACWKVGLGVDWWATPNVTVGLEGSYVAAFGDHEFGLLSDFGVEDAEIGLDYFSIGLGIAYHF